MNIDYDARVELKFPGDKIQVIDTRTTSNTDYTAAELDPVNIILEQMYGTFVAVPNEWDGFTIYACKDDLPWWDRPGAVIVDDCIVGYWDNTPTERV